MTNEGKVDEDDLVDIMPSAFSPEAYTYPGSAQMSLSEVEAAPTEPGEQQKYPLLS